MTNQDVKRIELRAKYHDEDAERLRRAIRTVMSTEDGRFFSLWLVQTVCGLYGKIDGMTDHADFIGRHNAGIDILEAFNSATPDAVLLAMQEYHDIQRSRAEAFDAITQQEPNP